MGFYLKKGTRKGVVSGIICLINTGENERQPVGGRIALPDGLKPEHFAVINSWAARKGVP
jgi:hypothetical protein